MLAQCEMAILILIKILLFALLKNYFKVVKNANLGPVNPSTADEAPVVLSPLRAILMLQIYFLGL